jgi:hypothetical protein
MKNMVTGRAGPETKNYYAGETRAVFPPDKPATSYFSKEKIRKESISF